jgi:membrane associated rhomboid family serine protease
MIPTKTAVPSRCPPIITWVLIAANCAVFLCEQSLGPTESNEFIDQFALIPARYYDLFTYGNTDLSASDFPPFVTMMFLHGGWLHLIFNMWTLWLFGPTVEDRLGHGRYLVFYFCCGIAAALAQVVFSLTSTVPTLGASGAIAGVVGCYMGLFPFARVIVLVPILFLPLFFPLPAAVCIGLWFLIQVFERSFGSCDGVVRGRRYVLGPYRRVHFRTWSYPLHSATGTNLPRLLRRRRRSRIQHAGNAVTFLHAIGDAHVHR